MSARTDVKPSRRINVPLLLALVVPTLVGAGSGWVAFRSAPPVVVAKEMSSSAARETVAKRLDKSAREALEACRTVGIADARCLAEQERDKVQSISTRLDHIQIDLDQADRERSALEGELKSLERRSLLTFDDGILPRGGGSEETAGRSTEIEGFFPRSSDGSRPLKVRAEVIRGRLDGIESRIESAINQRDSLQALSENTHARWRAAELQRDAVELERTHALADAQEARLAKGAFERASTVPVARRNRSSHATVHPTPLWRRSLLLSVAGGAFVGLFLAATSTFLLRSGGKPSRRTAAIVLLSCGFGLGGAVQAKATQENDREKALSTLLKPIQSAIDQAAAWIDALEVNPRKLRDELGLKGKKHLTEKLFLYAILYRETEPNSQERQEIRRRFARATGAISDPTFHRIPLDDKKRFREDILSYVHACALTRRVGLPHDEFRNHVAQYIPAILEDLDKRAVVWRMLFVLLLRELDFDISHRIESWIPETLIASHRGAGGFGFIETYFLTHEIFVLTGYGLHPLKGLSDESRLSLQISLPYLAAKALRDRNGDLLSELLVCLSFCHLDTHPVFLDGVRWLLEQQHADGSFGTVKTEDPQQKVRGRITLSLHETQTAVWALVEAKRSIHRRE